jgi:hypothetical protein
MVSLLGKLVGYSNKVSIILKSRRNNGTLFFSMEEQYRDKAGKVKTKYVVSLGSENSQRSVVIWSENHTVGHIAIQDSDLLMPQVPEKASGTVNMPCDFISAGKARNGARQWWCRSHQCYYGRKGDLESGKCKNASVSLHYANRPYVLKPEEFPGGVGVWCALPPAIVTGPLNAQKKRVLGIHVHARRDSNSKKDIDSTFPAIVLPHPDPLGMSVDIIHITPPAAYGWLDAQERETTLDSVKCPNCNAHHLDLGHFAQTPHQMHLCGNCGRMFRPKGKGKLVSNPLSLLQPTTGFVNAVERIQLRSEAFYKIEVWPSTPAIIWSLDRPQFVGIHVHAYKTRTERVIDETYGAVEVDGVELDRKELIMSLLHNYKEPKAANMFQANPEDQMF